MAARIIKTSSLTKIPHVFCSGLPRSGRGTLPFLLLKLKDRKQVKYLIQARPFFSSVVHNKDVTQLSATDEESILHALNTYSKELLSETGILSHDLLEELWTCRSQSGPFLSLGDVLALAGMQNETFKEICNHFKFQHDKTKSSLFNPVYLKYFDPSLSSQFIEKIQTVTTIGVCLDSVCFASANKNQEVSAWKHIQLIGSNHKRQTPPQILEQALHVLPHIPKADIYLAESRTPRKHTMQNMPIYMFISGLQTAIQTLLTSQHLETSGEHLFYLVKDSFVAKMFDLRIGGERVSGQHIVQQIEDGELYNQVVLEKNMWRHYHRLRHGVEKERYTNCLMTTLAFINYINPGHS